MTLVLINYHGFVFELLFSGAKFTNKNLGVQNIKFVAKVFYMYSDSNSYFSSVQRSALSIKTHTHTDRSCLLSIR